MVVVMVLVEAKVVDKVVEVKVAIIRQDEQPETTQPKNGESKQIR